ncbi:MAG: hypothetical protein O2967_09705 [Proteobacteria bacterium]|nr:hypothetical protein [Pseudomonadota bacterium]
MINLPGWCVRLAVLYALAGMALGEFMGASGDHTLQPVHAHINLLGWVTLALFGLIYKAWPAAAAGKLSLWQFILFNIGIIIQMTGVTVIYSVGPETGGPIAGIGSTILIIAMAMFALQVWRHCRS